MERDAAPSTGLPYIYQRLTSPNSIRLIHFPKSTEIDRGLSCTLNEVTLDSNPAFQALSYAWGDAVFPCQLICEDQTINITQNLYDALVQLTASRQELQIWVDAVCIDQSSVEEKSQQIPLMAEIYSKASNVLIWLGNETQDSAEAMGYLALIGKSFLDRGGPIREPKIEQNGERGVENKALWEAVYQDENAMQQTDVIWERSWFSRRWIIQEIAFAKSATVHCGKEQLEWAVLAKAAEVLAVLEGDGSQFINRRSGKATGSVCERLHNATKLERIRKELQASEGERKERQLLNCLDEARGFDCRDEKDRVFALLGIINHHTDNPFAIDYAKPTSEVFQAFAKYCLETGSSLEALSWAGLSNHTLCGNSLQLPSWVPDWRLPFRSPSDKLQGFKSTIRLNATFGVDRCFSLDDSSGELLINGALIDRVIAVCPSLGTMEEIAMEEGGEKWTLSNPGYISVWYQALESLLRAAFELVNVDVSAAEYVTGGESVWEALGRTLILDSNEVFFDMKTHPDSLMLESAVPEGSPQPKLADEFFVFRKIMFDTYGEFASPIVVRDSEGRPIESPLQPKDHALQVGDTVTNDKWNTVIDYEYMEYLTRLVDRCQDRSFFVTENGYIGLGPKDIQHDDLVGVIEGLHTSCVLRVHTRGLSKSASKDSMAPEMGESQVAKLQLIGECYTHGLMSEAECASYDSEMREWTIV
jgi:hypothetical protein